MTDNARSIWSERLAFLQAEEAKASDPDQRFGLLKRIREAKDKLAEFDRPVPDDHADLTRRLADLLMATDGKEPPPWHRWIEDVRAAVDLPPVPGRAAHGLAHWLLDYTHAEQPVASGLLSYAESRVRSPTLRERIALLDCDIQHYYRIPRTAIEEICARIAQHLCKTALAVRLSGDAPDVFAIEVYEFWSRGQEAPEQYRRVDLPIRFSQVDLTALDPDWAALPGVVSRPRAVAAIMEHLEGARFKAGVEVVAPWYLMMSADHAPEAWETEKGFTLGLRHPVVLRSEKAFEGRENADRKAHWTKVLNRTFKAHARDCTRMRGDELDAQRKQGRVAVIEACAHGAEQLDLCAEAGLSVVIWLRQGLEETVTALACLTAELSSCKVSQVPARLQALRDRHRADRGNPRFRIGLLMDHPLRRRPRQPMYQDA